MDLIRRVKTGPNGGARRMPPNLRAYRFATALVLMYFAFVVWFVINDASPEQRSTVADVIYPLMGLLVACLAWSAHTQATAPRARRGWALFAAAMGARALADGCWFWVEAVQHQAPFPSIADVGYSASYLLMFAAVWGLGAPRKGLDRRSLALDLLTVVTGSFIMVWYLLLEQITSGSSPFLQQVLAVGYPVADGLLLMAGAALLLRRPAWLSTSALTLLVVGLIAWAAADLGWTALSLGSDYAGGDWIDLVWLGAIVCWGLAADTTRRRVEPSARALPMVRMERLVPVVGITMGYGTLIAKLIGADFGASGVAVLGSLAIGLLLAARQAAVRGDHIALLARYYQLATVDALTGLLRREEVIEEAERALVRAKSSKSSVSLLMIDVDMFKQVNDAYGHAVGDAVLMTVSRLCGELRRDNDVMGRFGGDELIALLPGIDQAAALSVARRLIRSVADHPTMVEGASVAVTLSIGVTDSGGDEPLISVLARADHALYEAKAAGRDRAVAYRLDRPPVPVG